MPRGPVSLLYDVVAHRAVAVPTPRRTAEAAPETTPIAEKTRSRTKHSDRKPSRPALDVAFPDNLKDAFDRGLLAAPAENAPPRQGNELTTPERRPIAARGATSSIRADTRVDKRDENVPTSANMRSLRTEPVVEEAAKEPSAADRLAASLGDSRFVEQVPPTPPAKDNGPHAVPESPQLEDGPGMVPEIESASPREPEQRSAENSVALRWEQDEEEGFVPVGQPKRKRRVILAAAMKPKTEPHRPTKPLTRAPIPFRAAHTYAKKKQPPRSEEPSADHPFPDRMRQSREKVLRWLASIQA